MMDGFPYEAIGGLLCLLAIYGVHRFDLWVEKRRRGSHHKD